MGDVLGVVMQWLHFSSLAMLIGGILYGRLVMLRSTAALAPDAREALADRAAVAFRPFVLAAICGFVVSGVYNILTHPGHTTKYHILFGVKLLLALHVFTVALLITRSGNPHRARMMTGVAISGLAIIAIAAYLAHIF
jgi:cytochrome bd-type quinol oxidase subunit 2